MASSRGGELSGPLATTRELSVCFSSGATAKRICFGDTCAGRAVAIRPNQRKRAVIRKESGDAFLIPFFFFARRAAISSAMAATESRALETE